MSRGSDADTSDVPCCVDGPTKTEMRCLAPTAEHHITTTESLAAAAEMYDAAEPVKACEER